MLTRQIVGGPVRIGGWECAVVEMHGKCFLVVNEAGELDDKTLIKVVNSILGRSENWVRKGGGLAGVYQCGCGQVWVTVERSKVSVMLGNG
jgi:hypothetical protein